MKSVKKMTEGQRRILADIHNKWGTRVPAIAVKRMFGRDHSILIVDGYASDIDVMNEIIIARERAMAADPD